MQRMAKDINESYDELKVRIMWDEFSNFTPTAAPRETESIGAMIGLLITEDIWLDTIIIGQYNDVIVKKMFVSYYMWFCG